MKYLTIWLLFFGWGMKPAQAFLSQLDSVESLENLRDAFQHQRRLGLLCDNSLRPKSFNPHCYEFTRAAASGDDSSLEALRAAWLRECVVTAGLLTWAKVAALENSEDSLPEECLEALRHRREELLYRHSENPDRFWRTIRSSGSLTPLSTSP